jgi:hypothetical protein
VGGEGEQVGFRVGEMVRRPGEFLSKGVDDPIELDGDLVRVGLIENCSHQRSDPRL